MQQAYKRGSQTLYNTTPLYSIQPLGQGTPTVENILSYISRLAKCHNLSPEQLLRRFILPQMRPSLKLANVDIPGFLGIGVWANDIAEMIQQLTLQTRIEYMTLKPYCNVFPFRGMIRAHKAWCPECYVEQTGDVYDQLVWSVSAIKACSTHGVLLNEECDYCKMPIPWISNSVPGYCPHCKSWLGVRLSSAATDTLDMRMEVMIAENFSEFLEKCQGTQVTFDKNRLQSNFSELLNAAQSGVGKLKDLTGFSKSTLSYWRQKKSVPELRKFLMVSYSLGIPIWELLTGEQVTFNASCCEEPLIKPTRDRVARRVIDWEDIKGKLVSIDTQENVTPLSLKSIAAALDVSTRSLRQHVPDLCKNISGKYLQARSVGGKYVMDSRKSQIEQVTLSLISTGQSPTRRKVESLLPKKLSLRKPEYNRTWKKARIYAGNNALI